MEACSLQQRSLGLLDLPEEVAGYLATMLEEDDRIHLAAICRTLRAASVHWSSGFTYSIDTDKAPVEEELAWLCRVQGEHGSLQQLCLSDCELRCVPAQLEGLTRLTKLFLNENRLFDGLQHLPLRLRELYMFDCGLRRVPARIAGTTALHSLSLGANPGIQEGWQWLPPQLQELDISECGLREVPAEVKRLKRLSELDFGSDLPAA